MQLPVSVSVKQVVQYENCQFNYNKTLSIFCTVKTRLVQKIR